VTDDDLAVVNAQWTTPTEAAKMSEEADKVLVF
jgi:hypothetical protein